MSETPWERREEIGPCVLYQGDCLQVMDTHGPVDNLFSDPPYEAIMHAAKQDAAKRGLRIDGGVEPKPLDFEAIDPIRAQFTDLSARCTNGWFIVFCSPEGVRPWADEINPSSMKYKRACVWVKPDCAPQMNGQGPAMGAESFVCAWAGKGHARWNAGGKRGVYWCPVNPPDRDGRHPTEKPWRLFHELLLDFTQPGETVLDPFMGSGTTLVACVKTGRRGIGIEKDPEYFEVACDRVAKAVAETTVPELFTTPNQKWRQTDLLKPSKAAGAP